MRGKLFRFVPLLIPVILLFPGLFGCHHGCRKPGAQTEDAEQMKNNGPPLVIGTLAVYFDEIRAVYRPLLELMQQHLDYPVKFEMKSEPEEMARALRKGEVHVYLDSPLPALRVCRMAGGTPVFSIEKGGKNDFFSIIFCREDSGISSLKDLKGKSFVFSSNESTSGYGLPRTALMQAGLSIEENPDLASEENVHALFSGDGESTMFWVLDGKGDAGAVNNEYFLMLAGSRRGELKILGKTGSTPAGLVCLSPAMPRDRRGEVFRLLESLGSDSATKEELETFHNVTAFHPLSDQEIAKITHALGMNQKTK